MTESLPSRSKFQVAVAESWMGCPSLMLVGMEIESIVVGTPVSMNQPRLLPSVSRVRVPALGRTLVSYPVMVPSASCPVGRSETSILRLNGVRD